MRTGAVGLERTMKPINSMVRRHTTADRQRSANAGGRRPRWPDLRRRITDGAERRHPAASIQSTGKRRGVRGGGERVPPSRPCRACRFGPYRIRSEQVDDRSPRRSARGLVRTSRCHQMSVCSNAAAKFQCETGFSDSRFAGHQEEMCLALPRGVPCLDKSVPFEVAAHERGFGDGRSLPRTLLRFGAPARSC